MNSEKLKAEFQFYKDNQADLVKQYGGKVIIIKDGKVVGSYTSEIEAYKQGQKNFELGTFLIQVVESGEGNYSQTFYSRVTV